MKRKEKDYKPIKRDDKMNDLARRVTGMSSEELANYDFPNPYGDEMLKANEERKRELEQYFRARRIMNYVERVIGWFDGVVERFYSGGKKDREGR